MGLTGSSPPKTTSSTKASRKNTPNRIAWQESSSTSTPPSSSPSCSGTEDDTPAANNNNNNEVRKKMSSDEQDPDANRHQHNQEEPSFLEVDEALDEAPLVTENSKDTNNDDDDDDDDDSEDSNDTPRPPKRRKGKVAMKDIRGRKQRLDATYTKHRQALVVQPAPSMDDHMNMDMEDPQVVVLGDADDPVVLADDSDDASAKLVTEFMKPMPTNVSDPVDKEFCHDDEDEDDDDEEEEGMTKEMIHTNGHHQMDEETDEDDDDRKPAAKRVKQTASKTVKAMESSSKNHTHKNGGTLQKSVAKKTADAASSTASNPESDDMEVEGLATPKPAAAAAARLDHHPPTAESHKSSRPHRQSAIYKRKDGGSISGGSVTKPTKQLNGNGGTISVSSPNKKKTPKKASLAEEMAPASEYEVGQRVYAEFPDNQVRFHFCFSFRFDSIAIHRLVWNFFWDIFEGNYFAWPTFV